MPSDTSVGERCGFKVVARNRRVEFPCNRPIRRRTEGPYQLSNGQLLHAGASVRVPAAVAHAIPEETKRRLNLSLDDDYSPGSEVLVRPEEPWEHWREVEGGLCAYVDEDGDQCGKDHTCVHKHGDHDCCGRQCHCDYEPCPAHGHTYVAPTEAVGADHEAVPREAVTHG